MGKKSGKKSKSAASTAEQAPAANNEQAAKPSFLAGASSGIDPALASLFENSVRSL